jgi:hypothetical protein
VTLTEKRLFSHGVHAHIRDPKSLQMSALLHPTHEPKAVKLPLKKNTQDPITGNYSFNKAAFGCTTKVWHAHKNAQAQRRER